MKWRTAGVMVAIAVGAMMLCTSPAHAFTLSWNPVTTYTDNTTIGAEAGGVFYNVEMDGTQAATKISATSWVLPVVPKKSAHTFRVQTEIGTGEVSAWSPPFPWTSPAGNPNAPGQLKVVP